MYGDHVGLIPYDHMEAISKWFSTCCRREPSHRDEYSRRSASNVQTFDPVDGWMGALDLAGRFVGKVGHHQVVHEELWYQPIDYIAYALERISCMHDRSGIQKGRLQIKRRYEDRRGQRARPAHTRD